MRPLLVDEAPYSEGLDLGELCSAKWLLGHGLSTHGGFKACLYETLKTNLVPGAAPSGRGFRGLSRIFLRAKVTESAS